MKTRSALSILALILVFSCFAPAVIEQPEAAARRGEDVQVFSLQILVNQAYQMALEGSSLVMLHQMGRGGVFGEMIEKRGWTMIDQGERTISQAISGEEIKKLTDGKGSNPLLTTIKENANQALAAVKVIRTYLNSEMAEPELSRMHSLFTLLNHGMKMATDGANMIMLGRSGETGGAKDTLQKHGRAMMRDGRVFIIRLSDNKTMLTLHSSGMTIEASPAMAALHRSMEISMLIIDRLARI